MKFMDMNVVAAIADFSNSAEGGNWQSCGREAKDCVLFTREYDATISIIQCMRVSRRENEDTRRKCRGETSEISVALQARWRVFIY